jgi:hypothetical protein
MTGVHASEARVGDLIVAAYDEAARYATDPAEVSRLATRTVIHILERGRGVPRARQTPSFVVPGIPPSPTAVTLLPTNPPRLRLVPTGSCA